MSAETTPEHVDIVVDLARHSFADP
jgi:hypothetical protein